jgi:hypothetical protein
MTSFADFIINLINYFGIGLIFLFIFYFAIFYSLLLFLFRYIQTKDQQKQKTAEIDRIIALLISISASFFLTSFSGYFLFTQYFLAFISSMILIFFFFILIVNLLTNGMFFNHLSNLFSNPQNLSTSKMKYVPLFIILAIIIFALLAMYYAYQDYFISLALGTNPQSQIYQITFNEYILFLVIFFIVLGMFIMAIGSGGGETQKGGGETQAKSK